MIQEKINQQEWRTNAKNHKYTFYRMKKEAASEMIASHLLQENYTWEHNIKDSIESCPGGEVKEDSGEFPVVEVQQVDGREVEDSEHGFGIGRDKEDRGRVQHEQESA